MIPAWHDWGVMTDQEVRYDRIAEGYARFWAPAHRPSTLALLDEVAPVVAAGATRILDIGCGTGTLLRAAAQRWPQVRITGVDISAGMLAVADRGLADLPPADRERITLLRGPAARLPVPDGTFDVALSAFVLQLVPSRFRAILDARRALAVGGTLAYVTWLAGGAFAADEAYDAALVASGMEPRDPGEDRDEPPAPGVLAAQLRRAGFEGVTTREGELDHRFTPEGYLAFVSRFDDEDLFATLDEEARTKLEADLMARLCALPQDDLRMRLPIAYVAGRRSRKG